MEEELDFDEILALEIQRRRDFLSEFYGDRCEDFEPGCLCCKIWKDQDEWESLVL